MLNINGQRVEPAEIEAVLRRSPDVEAAEVLAHLRNGAATLIAFVVAIPGSEGGLDLRLREQLRKSLPGFMVPSQIVLVARMPMLPGGKIDTQALHALAVRPDGAYS